MEQDPSRQVSEIAPGLSDAGPLVCELFTSFEGLSALQPEWDQVILETGGEIFLTYDACRIWWKHYGHHRDLRIFVFRDGHRPVGLLPLFFERIWLGPVCVRVGKIVGSDFTISHFSPPIETPYLEGVLARFCAAIVEERWDLLWLGPLAGLYEQGDRLKEGLRRGLGRDYLVEEKAAGVQTYFELSGTWEQYLAGLSRNARHKFRQKSNLLDRALQNEGGALVSESATEAKVQEWFDSFVQMHQAHWQKQGKAGHFGDWPEAYEYHLEMAKAQLDRGRLRLMRCTHGSLCLGYEYAYRCGRTYQAVLNARTNSGPAAEASLGSVIFSQQAKQAMAEQVRYIDAMRGKYEYKLRLGGKLFPLRSLYIFPRWGLTRGRVRLLRLVARVLDLCYYRLWYCRLAPRLGLTSKRLWRIWIRLEGLAE
jgi:CelD/BcsL family acetyltransferase involved in cellulose biosynthesis